MRPTAPARRPEARFRRPPDRSQTGCRAGQIRDQPSVEEQVQPSHVRRFPADLAGCLLSLGFPCWAGTGSRRVLPQNLVHLRGGVRRPLDRQNQFNLLVAQMLLIAQVKNVLRSIPLVGGQIDPAILLHGLDPAPSVEIRGASPRSLKGRRRPEKSVEAILFSLCRARGGDVPLAGEVPA